MVSIENTKLNNINEKAISRENLKINCNTQIDNSQFRYK